MWLILFFYTAFCVWLEMKCHDPLAHEVSLLFLTAWSLQDHDILWPVVPHDIGVMFATDLRRSCLRIGVRHVEPLGGGTWDDGWHEWYVHVHVLLNWILLGPILYNIIIYIYIYYIYTYSFWMHFFLPPIAPHAIAFPCIPLYPLVWMLLTLVEIPRAEVLVENISEWFSLFFLLYRCVLGQGGWARTHWDPPAGFPAPGFAVLNIINSVTWWLSGWWGLHMSSLSSL